MPQEFNEERPCPETVSGQTSTGAAVTGEQQSGQPAGLEGQEHGQEAKQYVKEKGQEAKETIGALQERAKEATTRFVDRVRGRAEDLAGRQKDRTARRLAAVGEAMHQCAGRFDNEEDRAVARYANRAADRVERLSRTLEQGDLRALARRAEDFARRRPDVFLGAGFVAGLVLARFLRSSSRRREEELAEAEPMEPQSATQEPITI